MAWPLGAIKDLLLTLLACGQAIKESLYLSMQRNFAFAEEQPDVLNVFENTQPSVSPDGWVAGKDESQDVQMLVLAEGCWMWEWSGSLEIALSLVL